MQGKARQVHSRSCPRQAQRSAAQAQQAQAQAQAQAASKHVHGKARVLEPNRLQVELRASDLESLLPEDHRARLVWGYVERQDLSKLIEAIKARGSNAGRAAIDPRVLFALWPNATLDGVRFDGGAGRLHFRATAVERGVRLLDRGSCTLEV